MNKHDAEKNMEENDLGQNRNGKNGRPGANNSFSLKDAIWSPDARDYVKYWIKANGYKHKPSGQWIKQDGDAMKAKEARLKCFLDYQVDYNTINQELQKKNKMAAAPYRIKLPYKSKDLILAAFDHTIYEVVNESFKELRVKLKYDSQADPGGINLKSFVANLTTERIPLTVCVLAQFIWLVKRKLYGLPVIHHLMPILAGGGGEGKSSNLDRFLGPVSDFCWEINNAGQLIDDRAFAAYEDNLVAKLNELAKLGSQDFNQVKNVITAPTVSAKPLYTNTMETYVNRISFFGTTNLALNEQLFDSTMALRRFYEIKVDKKIDIEISTGLNYLAIWRAINENGEAPLLSMLDEYYECVDKLRTPDLFEEFFTEFEIDISKPCTYHVASRDGIYKALIDFAKSSGYDAPWITRIPEIRKRLLNRGLKQVTVRGEKVWKVNEDCKLNPAYAHRVLPALIESAQDLKDVEHIPELEKEMLKAAKAQDYVRAATIKKRIDEINGKGNGLFDL